MNLTFENHKNGNGGFISLKNEIEEIGRLTYTIQPEKNTLIISYVMVFLNSRDKEWEKKLVENGIEFSRENQWIIIPHCSYARSVMLRMKDIEDVFPQ